METKPTTWQEQGPFTSLVDMQGETGANVGRHASLQERKAPKAMPEEDLDAPEPGVKVEAPQGSWTNEITEVVDVINIGNQTSAGISLCTLGETQEAVTEIEERPEKLPEAKEESRKADNPCEEDSPPTQPLSALSAAECGEKEGFSSLEGEVEEGISEAEPTEDSQESAKTPKLLQPAHRDVCIPSQLDLTTVLNAGDIYNGETETSTSPPARSGLSDLNSSDGRPPPDSPPFADESGEEEGTGTDMTNCQEQSGRRELSCVGFQPSRPEKRDSALPANGSVRQEEAVLPQKQPELSPRGLNQEAAQQVFGQGSPPGSAVAMEPANQGGEASQGFSCVAAVRARSRRAGERTEGGNEQTGGVGGQNKSGVEKSEAGVRSESKGLFRYLRAVQTQELKAERNSGIPLRADSDTRMRTDVHDDSQSDSGVSADFHSFRTLNSSTSMSADSPVSTETPIEREIRRAIEREQSLRRSRGLPNQRSSPEYVEVPLRRSFQSQSVAPKWSQNKDREFAGKKMQQEIHEESRREQDLVKIGKIPGFYDKGTVRQIKERKQLFETLQISPELPPTISPKSKTPSWSSTSSEDLNITLESQDESGTSTPEHTYADRKPTTLNSSRSQTSAKGLDQSSLRGPRFSEGSGCQIIILENSLTVPAQKHYKAKAQAEAIAATDAKNSFHSSDKARGHDGLMKAVKEQEGKPGAVSKENPFFKLRSSTNLDKVKQDIQEAKDREKELHTLRLSLYGGINATEATSKKENPVPGPLSNGRSGTYEGRQSADQVSARPSVQTEEERILHPEIHKSPRTPRQKNPLVQLWESGLVNSYNLEDD
ncbi:uncharacterized protein si:ch211-207j7.2 [Fundulus heteroclitus]|uniref:uncharacterized protein si:ch211-207j7.2 n=1 Tax=Fundulus heteroclitus TaxID=8078 RepID=UPI00165BE75A|nr:uncharacterized protein si:ch211-207j7.2 [Fundulus heteroclitus]